MDETTTVSTSDASTSSAPSSAPAPAAAPAAPAARPSMKQALVQADASTAASGAPVPGTTDPTAAAALPASPKGPIPFEVHHTALENARKKEREALQAQYAWTTGLNPDEVKNALGWRQAAQADPTRFLQEFIAEGLANPQIRPTILSLMGQNLNAARAASPKPGALPKPRFQTTDDQGNSVAVYTADDMQQFATALTEQLRGEVKEAVQPYEQERQERDKLQKIEAAKTKLTSWTTTTMKDMSSLEGFTEHEAEIKAVYAAMPVPEEGGFAAAENALRRAYTQVVIPHLRKSGQDATLAKLKRDAAATTLNPSSAGVSMPAKRPKSFKEALLWAESQQQAR